VAGNSLLICNWIVKKDEDEDKVLPLCLTLLNNLSCIERCFPYCFIIAFFVVLALVEFAFERNFLYGSIVSVS